MYFWYFLVFFIILMIMLCECRMIINLYFLENFYFFVFDRLFFIMRSLDLVENEFLVND